MSNERDASVPVILDCDATGEWSHRYGDLPAAHERAGTTVCCERPVYVPAGKTIPLGLYIDDCCATPGAAKPVDLPPYSGEHAACRKCGSKAVETKYSTAASTLHGIGPRGYPGEWLARRCVVCQAKWDEATVDAVSAHPAPLQ